MLLKLNCYKLKLEYYNCIMLNAIPMVTTNEIVIEYTKEMRGKLKLITIKK